MKKISEESIRKTRDMISRRIGVEVDMQNRDNEANLKAITSMKGKVIFYCNPFELLASRKVKLSAELKKKLSSYCESDQETERVLTKDELKKQKGKALPFVKEKSKMDSSTYNRLMEWDKLTREKPLNAIKVIMSDFLKLEQSDESKKIMLSDCEEMSRLVMEGNPGHALIFAYNLGKMVTMERLRPYIKLPSGRNTTAPNPIYWGKKFNDYRIGHKEYHKNPKSKNAARFAQDQILKDWKNEFPADPITGIITNPVSEGTFINYEKAYKKTLKDKP